LHRASWRGTEERGREKERREREGNETENELDRESERIGRLMRDGG